MPIRGSEDKREIDKEKLKELAFIDDLTSLYNRRYLYQYLPTELQDIQRAGQGLCLFMMDIDNFKHINDTYGHLCGDRILVEIAEILRKSFREEDTVVRYAGDEFVAILPGAKEDVALNIAKRIIEKLEKNIFTETEGKADIRVTISIGMAFFPGDAQNPEKLIYEADRALYSSKRGGRNRMCTTKDLTAKMLDETKLQEIFPSAEMVGRQRQLNKLEYFLTTAEKGRVNLALIRGDKGIGKSRLINEFNKDADAEKLTKISVLCSPELSVQPYQTLIIILQNLYASLGARMGEFIGSLTQRQTEQLVNYVPFLRQFLPADFKTAPPSQHPQTDLFKAICRSLSYIVNKGGFLVSIDDFHWIDKETLQLFNYIAKELDDITVLIVGAYREEELEKRTDGSSPKQLLYQMKQGGLAQEFALEPLEKKEVLKMITTIFSGIQVNPELVDIIYDISTGNPLFVEEVLRSLANRGLIFHHNGEWHSRKITQVTLPPFLKEAIQKRISELDEETKPVISAAAVIGQVFNFDVLCQLVEKDSGYVLEIIDRAVKQRIILPEGQLQTDKFKFNSGAIRDAIYNSLESATRESLHKRLALIEERLYKDNIDSVAASLGYHFAKARETKKADLYSRMVLEKVKAMPSYADVFGFLEDTLLKKPEEEEEEPEAALPLSKAGRQLVASTIRALRLANMNIQLYPAHSAIRKSFVEEAHKLLTELLKKDHILIISTTEGILLINGQAIGEKASQEAGADAFVEIMISQRIKNITFKKNLTKAELAVFLENLSRRYDELLSEGGLAGKLRKNNVTHIKVNEIRFEQTSAKPSKQKGKFEKAMLIDYLLGKVSGSPRENISSSINISRAKAAIQDFTDEEILEAVSKELLRSPESLGGIRRLLRGFFADPQRKQRLLPKLEAKLTQLGMSEEEISWVLQEKLWQNMPLKEKVDRLLKLPSDSYIRLEASQEMEGLMSKLLESDRYSEASKVVDKLLGQLEEGKSKAVRSATINDLEKISQRLISKEKYFLLEQIINSLMVQLDKEKDLRVYSLLAQLSAAICAALIKKQNFIQATGILKEFNLRLGQSSQLLEMQKEALRQAKDTIVASAQSVAWLAKLLEEKIEQHSDFWELSKVISEIGTAIIGPLFTLTIAKGPYADPFKTYALRWSIAKVLKGMGKEGILYLKQKLSDKSNDLVKVALELIGHIQSKDAVKYLRPLVKHTDLDIRKEAVATLGKIGGKEAVDLLSEMIVDKDRQIRLAAVWALANIGTPQVLHIVKPLLKDKELSEEAKKIIHRIVEKR